MSFMRSAALPVALALWTAGTGLEIDYAALYDKGTPFSTFLEEAQARRSQWRSYTRDAVVSDEAVARVRAIEGGRRLLVVADASCSDSVNILPYLAKLVDAAPDRLAMRIVDSTTGRAVMEAHRTPDGRAATPTVVVLDGAGRAIGVFVERPSKLETWYIEQGKHLDRAEFAERKQKWYTDDAGRSTVEEVVALVVRTSAVEAASLDARHAGPGWIEPGTVGRR